MELEQGALLRTAVRREARADIVREPLENDGGMRRTIGVDQPRQGFGQQHGKSCCLG